MSVLEELMISGVFGCGVWPGDQKTTRLARLPQEAAGANIEAFDPGRVRP
jgi:hypothetical protein